MAHLTIHGNTFTPRSPSVSIVGQVNAEQVTFVVDESWSGLELQAQFSNASIDREPVPVALDETMTCFIPSEATALPGKVYVALAGYDDGVQIKLTELLHYSNAKTGADPNGGVPPEEQTPGYLNQITQILNETRAVAQSVRDDADQGKFDGKPGKNGEPGKSPKEEGGTWWLWNEEEQKWVDTGILVAGKNGISPKVETQPVTGGTRVIITDADGEKSFDVLNGKNGNPGKNGETPNITIGRVDTLPSGSKATAEITGQTPNLTLNMGIPQGREGPAGLGVPDPTPEDAGKFPVVNPEGNGYIFGEAGVGGGEVWDELPAITLRPDVLVYYLCYLKDYDLLVLQADNGYNAARGSVTIRFRLRDSSDVAKWWDSSVIVSLSDLHFDVTHSLSIVGTQLLVGLWANYGNNPQADQSNNSRTTAIMRRDIGLSDLESYTVTMEFYSLTEEQLSGLGPIRVFARRRS